MAGFVEFFVLLVECHKKLTETVAMTVVLLIKTKIVSWQWFLSTRVTSKSAAGVFYKHDLRKQFLHSSHPQLINTLSD